MITILTPHFPPLYDYGGPNKSLAGVCAWLTQEEIDFQVLSKFPRLKKPKENTPIINANVYFKKRISLWGLIKMFRKSDIIWINTLYNYSFSLLPIMALLFVSNRKVIISPRGQLLVGALNSKKRLYLKGINLLLKLSGHKLWIHFANSDEQQRSVKTFKTCTPVLFNNAISGNVHENVTVNKLASEFVLGYFGRISPIKNIEFIINLLPSLPETVVLEVHGSILDDAYFKNLQLLVDSLELSERVQFLESYNNLNFVEKSKNVDLVLIPSLSESFCHVFFEVIEVNKLVVASTGLPWENVNNYVLNTVIPLKADLWVSRINEVYNMDKGEYKQQQEHLVAYYNTIYKQAQKDTISVINQILK